MTASTQIVAGNGGAEGPSREAGNERVPRKGEVGKNALKIPLVTNWKKGRGQEAADAAGARVGPGGLVTAESPNNEKNLKRERELVKRPLNNRPQERVYRNAINSLQKGGSHCNGIHSPQREEVHR